MKKLIILTLFLASPAWALIPLEGLLLGNVQEDLQFDPISNYFKGDETNVPGSQLSKRLLRMHEEAQSLQNICKKRQTSFYANDWDDKQAKRSVIAHLQWRALDYTVKSIGHYASTLQMEEEAFKNLSEKLIDQNCSPNISVYGHNLLKKNFIYYLKNQTDHQKQDQSLSFIPKLSDSLNSKKSTEKNLYYAIGVFRSFCSWGGDPNELRMVVPFLKDPLIFSWLMNELEGKKISWNESEKDWEFNTDKLLPRVSCAGLVCRSKDANEFMRLFPRLMGSISIKKDLEYLYCENWQFAQIDKKNNHPNIKKWAKQQTEEDQMLEVSWLQSRILDIPHIWSTVDKFNEMKGILAMGIELNVQKWAQENLDMSKRIFFLEESIEIRPIEQNPGTIHKKKELALNFSATLGEMDRIFKTDDKIQAQLKLTLSQNYLHWIRKSWIQSSNQLNENEKKIIQEKISEVVKIQLKAYGEKLPFVTVIDGVSKLISKELVRELINSEDYKEIEGKDKMLEIPVKFYFGINALQYMSLKT